MSYVAHQCPDDWPHAAHRWYGDDADNLLPAVVCPGLTVREAHAEHAETEDE